MKKIKEDIKKYRCQICNKYQLKSLYLITASKKWACYECFSKVPEFSYIKDNDKERKSS